MVNLINMLNNHIDKVVHFLGGFFICSFLPYELIPLVAVFLGIGKEVWDSNNPPHEADAFDAIFTVIGGLISMIARGLYV
jgi:hypothetical protein